MKFGTNRVEAFSDGVFAIAITLLVLDLRVPTAENESLAHGLAAEWPSYAAYAVSFLIIGIIWINHHAIFRTLRFADRPLLFANLALLGVVSAIPFPTRLLATYLDAGFDGSIAAAVYGATMLAMSVCFSTLWLVATRERAALLYEQVDAAAARSTMGRFGLGLVAYAVAIALSFVSAVVALIVHGVIALYYCFDQVASGQPETSAAVESR